MWFPNLNLLSKFALFFSVFAIMAVINYFGFGWYFAQQRHHVAVVHAAGRQCALSHEIAFLSYNASGCSRHWGETIDNFMTQTCF